jgi:hypothetical protein
MYTVRIEHAISDFDTWKAAFDRAAGLRQGSGVRRHRVARPIDDSKYVMVDLDFDTEQDAAAFIVVLREKIWRSPEASPALVGAPQARIVESVESVELA